MSHHKSKTTVYHHTTREGAKAIFESGRIKQTHASQGDARFGTGTYVTRMGPRVPKDKVAKNNYDGRWKKQRDQGKTDVALEITIPKRKVTCYNPRGRDVCKVDGNISAKYIKKVHIRKEGDQRKYKTFTMSK
ncbi:uncharacterized protein LOC143059806 [Mytilus galloprovincialis]|uniref:uncharacterized protein LOC143059806 n=1 Tax=Mytilus galloprovincialis TaxID=29158 RepID=UPI003F7BA7B2